MMKLSFWSCKFAGVLGLALLIAGPAKADLVVNGTFGTGDFTGWTLTGDTSGAFVTGVPGAFAAALTTSGDDGFIGQDLTTVVGQKYNVSFDVQGDGATPNLLIASLGGTTLTTLTDFPLTVPNFTTETAVFTASSTTSALLFQFRDVPGFLNLTNVSVTTAAVPEPSAVLSAGLGVVMLAGYVLRKRRGSAATSEIA